MDIITIRSDEHFLKTYKLYEMCFVQFSASWCAPCRKITPTIFEYFEKNKSKFKPNTAYVYCDVDVCQNISNHLSLDSVPAFMLLTKRKRSKLIPYERNVDIEEFVSFYCTEALMFVGQKELDLELNQEVDEGKGQEEEGKGQEEEGKGQEEEGKGQEEEEAEEEVECAK